LQGAALGGLVIGVVEALVVGYGNPTYRDPIVFGVLIVILLVKPTGLLGASEREKV
jgi:branched-chain amino acid transport system permease protein